jgi:hypothetical protein
VATARDQAVNSSTDQIEASVAQKSIKREDKDIYTQNEHAQRMLILSDEHHEELERSKVEVDQESRPAQKEQAERADGQPQASEAQPHVMKPSRTELKGVKLTKKPELQQEAIVKPAPNLEIVPNNVSQASATPLKEEQPQIPASEITEPAVPFTDVLTEHHEPQPYANTEVLSPAEANKATEGPVFYNAAINYEEVLSSADNQTYETFVQDAIVSLNPESIGPITPNLFEEFILTKVQPEEVPDLESVIASANDQPLEETLMQFTFSLSETSQDPAQPSIVSAIKDVVETLKQGTADPITAEAEPVITPELTQKLLILLRAVGYENPREVLVDFISHHSLEFLLQAIQYLYQLLNDDNRRELSPKLSVNLSSLQAADSFSSRLGKDIVHYFFLYKIVPDL